jgi:hypothetical protein
MSLSFSKLHGQLTLHSRIVYVSADPVYYDLYVRPLIHSIVSQISWIHVHVHLVLDQASPADLETHERVTHSWEIINHTFLERMPMSPSTARNEMNSRMLKTMDPLEIKKKIYYSCARFMRMAELFGPDQQVLQIDADTILNAPFTLQEFDSVTQTPRAMRKPKDPGTLIASCIGLGTGSAGQQFREHFRALLLDKFALGAYWFMDQDCLREAFSDIEFETIDILWCSWGNKRGMRFFTGKGDKKNQSDFVNKLESWR